MTSLHSITNNCARFAGRFSITRFSLQDIGDEEEGDVDTGTHVPLLTYTKVLVRSSKFMGVTLVSSFFSSSVLIHRSFR